VPDTTISMKHFISSFFQGILLSHSKEWGHWGLDRINHLSKVS
jgi:hypothetical protein